MAVANEFDRVCTANSSEREYKIVSMASSCPWRQRSQVYMQQKEFLRKVQVHAAFWEGNRTLSQKRAVSGVR